MRSVLSPRHHSRHLEDLQERAAFEATAPIETRSYADLADAVQGPHATIQEIELSLDALYAELTARAGDNPSHLATLCQTRRVLGGTIEQKFM